jgi:hypothetical protein
MIHKSITIVTIFNNFHKIYSSSHSCSHRIAVSFVNVCYISVISTYVTAAVQINF